MALLCWLQAGLKKPFGVAVSWKCETGALLWSCGALDSIQGFAVVKNVHSEGKRPLHEAPRELLQAEGGKNVVLKAIKNNLGFISGSEVRCGYSEM